MAGELTTTQSFSDGEQVTSTKLNNIIANASFTASAVTGTTLTVTGGKLKVGTITASEMGASSVPTAALADFAVTGIKIAPDAVTTTKIADGNVTFDKMSTGSKATQSNMESEAASHLVTSDKTRYAPSAAKAYGKFSISDTSRNLLGDYNITSVTRLSSSTTKVTLDTNMASGGYMVLCTVMTSNASPVTSSAAIFNPNAGDFSIKHTTEGTGDLYVSFAVFGVSV